MSKLPVPVLGFNNNVRHRGRIFHIQTEDSGVRSPRIVTHLFADGGRIIRTLRTEYTEHLERNDLQAMVRRIMKGQHKAMFALLRAGDLDEMLEAACGPLPLPADLESGRLPRAACADEAGVATPPVSAGAVPAAASRAEPLVVGKKARSAATGVNRSERPALGRPASRYGSAPMRAAQSIFGDGVISEQSLDEVILSYIADDLDGSSE